MEQSVATRYEAKADRSGGPDACHPWTGYASGGYGQLWVDGQTQYAHRVGWELQHGPIPDGFQVLHKCDSPPCQNDRHWFLGTHADNMADKARKGRGLRQVFGERSGATSLSEADALAIRCEYRAGVPPSVLARRYGTSRQSVWRIATGRSWSYLNELEATA